MTSWWVLTPSELSYLPDPATHRAVVRGLRIPFGADIRGSGRPGRFGGLVAPFTQWCVSHCDSGHPSCPLATTTATARASYRSSLARYAAAILRPSTEVEIHRTPRGSFGRHLAGRGRAPRLHRIALHGDTDARRDGAEGYDAVRDRDRAESRSPRDAHAGRDPCGRLRRVGNAPRLPARPPMLGALLQPRPARPAG